MFKFVKVFLLVVATILFLSACEKSTVTSKSPIQVKSQNEIASPEEQAEIIIDKSLTLPETAATSSEINRLKDIGKLQICPDMFIENKMPREVPGVEREYFIIDGERRELDEFDMIWVEENCELVKQIVN